MAKKTNTSQEESLEKKLWKASDKLHNNIETVEYNNKSFGLLGKDF